VNELEQDIALAVERAHTAEQRMREAEDRALAAEDKALEEAERARAAEDAVTAAAEAAAAAAVVVQPPEPTPGPAALDDAVLAQFEERIVAAEERAGSAEARLKGLLEMPTASAQEPTAQELPTAQEPTAVEAAAAVDDLRTRLARTASRKKLGGDDGSPVPASRVETAAVQVAVAPGADLQRSMAREIHGPLSTLKGLSLSLKGAVSTSEGKEMVRQMNATVKKLDRLASDLAEAAEISDGSLQLNRRRTDLAAFVSRVVGEADGISNLDIRMELDPAHASVDPSRLQQIVDGMLNHARERTGASGTIHIRLTGDEDGATLAVDDEGEPNAGVGPHLLLASRLAELHGGRLWSEPRTAGDGASVKVFLPAEPSKT
jgi:signal transduction histidine kinase